MKQKHFKSQQKGFTLIEISVVMGIIGIIGIIIAPTVKAAYANQQAKQVDVSLTTAANYWRSINAQCSTSTDTAASLVMATPSAANSLALVIDGASYVAAADVTCYNDAGVKPLKGKFSGSNGAYTVAGYPVSWNGGAAPNPIVWVIPNMDVAVVLPLYKKYSSVAGAKTATALPATADTTDPIVQFSAPTGGTTTLTFNVL